MRASVIEHPARSRYVTLRPHYVEMCGHGCAAMLLAVFEGWTNWKLQHGELEATEDGTWLRLTLEQLEADLCGAFGRSAIRSGLERLEERGYIVRRDGNGSDRASLWRLNAELVQSHVAKSHHGGAISDLPACEIAPSTRAQEEAEKNKEQNRAIREVWDHYVQVFNATRQDLNPTRRTIIRNALKVRSVEECKLAIDGLRASPFHNGQNEQRKQYLGIQYALKGNSQRGESNDERIDKMIELAPSHGGGELPRRVTIRLDGIRRYVQSGYTREPRRSLEQIDELKQMGYDVELLERPPFVKVTKR